MIEMKQLVDLYRNQNQTVTDAFDQIVVNIFMQKEKQQHKSFVICGCNPGAGTTSTAVELAISLSVAGWRTVLVDADLRKDTQYKRLNQKAEVGISEYIVNQVPKEDIICKTNWNDLFYISSGNNRKETPVKLLCSVRMGKLIEELNKGYDFILFDVPSLGTAVDAKILAAKADCTFLVVESGVTTFQNLSEAKKQLEEVGANIEGVIANKLPMEEYRRVVKDYNYFHDKEYAERGRTERDTKKKESLQNKKKGALKRLFGGMLVMLLFLHINGPELTQGAMLLDEQNATAAYSQFGSTSMLPTLLVSAYEIEEGSIEPGEPFTLNVEVRNENHYIGAYQVLASLYVQTDGIYLQQGETNQHYIEYIPPNGISSFQINMVASEAAENDKALIEIRFDYTNENGTPGANTTIISPHFKANSKLEILSLTAANRAKLGARALLNIRYANTGETELKNIQLNIEGNIEEKQKKTTLKAPEAGQQNYLDWYVVFTEPGNQHLSVTINYEDERGNSYQLEAKDVTVLVIDPAYEADSDSNLSTENDTKRTIDGIWAVAIAAFASIIALFAVVSQRLKKKGLNFRDLRIRQKGKKGDSDGSAENS